MASPVSSAEDVVGGGEGESVQIEEFLGILIVSDSIDGLLRKRVADVVERRCFVDSIGNPSEFVIVVADRAAVRLGVQPCGNVAVDVGFAVPHPRASVKLHFRVAKNIGISAGVGYVLLAKHLVDCSQLVVDVNVAVSSAIYIAAHHSALDVHKSVAVDRSVFATAVDVAPNAWHHIVGAAVNARIAVDDMHNGVAVDAADVVVLVGFSLFAAHTSAIHVSKNVAAADVDKRAVAISLVA